MPASGSVFHLGTDRILICRVQGLELGGALATTCKVNLTCRSAGISRATAYAHCDASPKLAAAWHDAVEAVADALEAEAQRRALDGWDEHVTCRHGLVRDEHGQPVMQRRHSDTLLLLLLRAYRPERFRDRATVDSRVPYTAMYPRLVP